MSVDLGGSGATAVTLVPAMIDRAAKVTIEMTSGYLARVKDQFPKTGSKTPWKLHQNYILDRRMLRRGKLEDGALEFSKSPGSPTRRSPTRPDRAGRRSPGQSRGGG